MAREWTELFTLDESRLPAASAGTEKPERQGRFFRRLRENLKKTRDALGAEISQTLFDNLDEETWERLEEALIMADCGAKATADIVGRLEQEATVGGLTDPQALQDRLAELLAEAARPVGDPAIDLRHGPTVIMVCGVNGTGKTTSIGKLANTLSTTLGQKVVLGAADTFRAAAVNQLRIWGERADVEVVTGQQADAGSTEGSQGGKGSDPASVAFEAVRRGREIDADVVIVDTAGRLHTQAPLMEELAKVRRVIGKQLEGAPHEILLTVDATTGQNGLRQAKEFSQAAPVTGIVLTKLDGTAKGGIAIAIAQELSIPVKLIGLGEGLEDLRPFDADDFARALVRSDDRIDDGSDVRAAPADRPPATPAAVAPGPTAPGPDTTAEPTMPVVDVADGPSTVDDTDGDDGGRGGRWRRRRNRRD
ncbi:MAG: signal recognition particle-docking protein FtsY [Solirubrobacteraceae bacterium]